MRGGDVCRRGFRIRFSFLVAADREFAAIGGRDYANVVAA
jgi:hypothetical protein